MNIPLKSIPLMPPPVQNIVFDLDGTLCPHGKYVSARTASHVASLKWYDPSRKIHLCTASTVGRTVPRIQELISRGCLDRIWCGHGTTILDGSGDLIERRVRRPIPDDMYARLCELREGSKFKNKGRIPLAGDGSCYSFSVLGKRFTPEQRADYVEFDTHVHERESIIDLMRTEYPEWNFFLGGQTGIDIVPKPFGKREVIDRLLAYTNKLTYYGDDYGPRGGDFEVKELLERQSQMWNLPHLKFVPIDVTPDLDDVMTSSLWRSVKKIN